MNDDRTYDAIVVGGGIAGLTAAAYLAKAGLTVLLCEKEHKTGGLVTSFETNGFTFDGGIRGIENSGIILPMLRQLGLEIEFLPSRVSIGLGEDVIAVDSPASLDAYQQMLEKHFPHNAADIAAILAEIRKVMGYMEVQYGIDNPLFMDLTDLQYVSRTILPWVVRYTATVPKIQKLYRPVEAYLAQFSQNQALLDMIAQHFFRHTPAYFALSYFSLYLDYRYPRGGTGCLPAALEQFIRARGGEIRTGTAVTRVDPGAKTLATAGGETLRYRRLVWAADLKALYRLLDTTTLADRRAVQKIEARRDELAGKRGNDSVFTLYLTTSLAPAYFAGISHPHFFYTPSSQGLSTCPVDEIMDGPGQFSGDKERVFAWLRRFLALNTFEISIPVLRDASLAPPGQAALIVSLLFDYSLAKHIQAAGWYDEFRALMTQGMVDVLDASIYPGLKAAVTGSFTATPLTIEKITGNSDGAITGWAFTNDSMPAVHQLTRIASSVLTPIPGTYQAGQWTYSPSGLPISVLTGKLAADRVIKDLK